MAVVENTYSKTIETCQLLETSQTDQNEHVVDQNRFRQIVAFWDLPGSWNFSNDWDSIFLARISILDQLELPCFLKLFTIIKVTFTLTGFLVSSLTSWDLHASCKFSRWWKRPNFNTILIFSIFQVWKTVIDQLRFASSWNFSKWSKWPYFNTISCL